MKMVRKTKWVLVIAVCLSIQTSVIDAGELSMSGDVSLVSTYVWRGIQQFEGTAAQGTITGNYGALDIGLWYSNVCFGNGMVMETDPFLSLVLPTGKINSSLGLAAYTYDFKKFSDTASVEIEISVSVGAGPFGLSIFYAPNQNSMKSYSLNSAYWLQLSAEKALKDLNISAQLEYGNYSSRFVAPTRKTAVSDMVLTLSKTFSDNLSVDWNAVVPFDSDMKALYWMKISYTF